MVGSSMVMVLVLRNICIIDGSSLISNISNKSIIAINSVCHSLDTSVGKCNLVGSMGHFSISIFLSSNVYTRVSIRDSVLEGVGLGALIIVSGGLMMMNCWSMVCWRRNSMVGWSIVSKD
uniref:Uncharacterized protein n=1 Tax=Lepeophtheirus salmonis TaxID=72036 RepID=A0A0K2UXM8_LEPSM